MSLLTILLLIVLVAALCEAPLFVVISALSVVCFWHADGTFESLQNVLIEMNRLASLSVLVALPLFTLSGSILTYTKAPQRIMALMEAMVGWLPGGLAIAGLCSCAIFTTLTGASGATIVALGSVLYPLLREKGYSETFSLGLLAVGGSLGLLFPPSLPIILYGVVSGIDIQKIFAAGLVPGILLLAALSLYAVVASIRDKGALRGSVPFSLRQLGVTLRASIWELPVLVIIFGGIYGGFATIAEVSALVLIYIIVVECVILKEVHWRRQLPGIMVESTVLSGAIIVILAAALGFTAYLVDEMIPNAILEWLTAWTQSPLMFLLGINVLLLVVGCIMDVFSAIVVVVPIIAPVALRFGVDPFHLAVIFLVNLEIGYCTPPVGINLFIASLKFNKPITLLYRATMPFLVILLICLAALTYIPALSLGFKP